MAPRKVLLSGVFAATALAQTLTSTTTSDDEVVTVTTFVDPTDCSTAPDANSAGAGAATGTTTVMTEHCSDEPCPNQSAGPLTTYVTVYSTWCPEGLKAATYTVTEPCSVSSGEARPADHIPQGFTVVTESCDVCTSPTAGVITKPAPAPAPAPALPTGQVPAPAPAQPAPGNGGGEAPAASPAPALGGGSPAPAPAPGNAAPAPAPAAGNSSIACAGGECSPKSSPNFASSAAASSAVNCGAGLLSIAALLMLL